MIQEEKQLLLKVLCEGLQYGVKVNVVGYQHVETLVGLDVYKQTFNLNYADNQPMFTRHGDPIIKPYLRPMESMTEEEQERCEYLILHMEDWMSYYDYLDSRHLDYRDLIPRGLALEAQEDMYKF